MTTFRQAARGLQELRLERYAAKTAEMRGIFDSAEGWGRLLAAFAQAAERQ